MARPKLALLTVTVIVQATLATLLASAARAQSAASRDVDALLCKNMSDFSKRNDFGPCNRFIAAPGFSPYGRALALEMRARAYTIRGYFDHAIQDYNTALGLLKRPPERNDRIALTLLARGKLYEIKGDLQAAEKDYREALRDPQGAYYARKSLEGLDELRAGKPAGPFGTKPYDRTELDREDLQRVLLNNTIFAATARDAEPWRAYFGGDGSMAIVYANSRRKNGRWAIGTGNVACITLEGSEQECRMLAKMVVNFHRSSTYYLWIDAKSGKVSSHVFEIRPGKFIDRAE